MRTPWDGYTPDDLLQARDPRYPVEVGGPGSLPAPARPLTRIAVKSVNRIVIVQVTDIVASRPRTTTCGCGRIVPTSTRRR